MQNLRNIVGVILALALAAFALPSLAHGDDEKFSLVISGTGPFTATVKNLADDDDSIQSFKITAPTGKTISAASINAAASNAYDEVPDSVAGIGTGYVTFKGVKIKKGQTIVVNLAADLNATTCGTNTFLWNATAWESSTASGETFKLVSLIGDRTTTVTVACQYSVSIAATGTFYRGTSKQLDGHRHQSCPVRRTGDH